MLIVEVVFGLLSVLTTTQVCHSRKNVSRKLGKDAVGAN